MDLPMTSDNHHVVVFQDFLTKWPLAFPVPDQKAIRLVKLLTEEVIQWFGVPERLLSDQGTNLLSHLILDVCKKLGVQYKLNTTAYHPYCDGMVEQFNCTLLLSDVNGTVFSLEYCSLTAIYHTMPREKNHLTY